MRIAHIRVEKNATTHVTVKLAEWEIPILEFEYGPEKISVSKVEVDNRPYPDGGEELARLAMKYGNDEQGTPKAHVVFGAGARGAQTIDDLIEHVQRKAEQESEAAQAAQAAAAEQREKEIDAEVERRLKAREAEKVAAEKAVAELTGEETPPKAVPQPAAPAKQTLGLKK